MFIYDKKLQYPVKIDKPNPRLASIIISQYGGPDGELGASLRYLSQRYSMPFDELKGLLTDIGTEGSKRHPVRLGIPIDNKKDAPFGASFAVTGLFSNSDSGDMGVSTLVPVQETFNVHNIANV